MEELRSNSLMKNLQANFSQPLTRNCVDVREWLMKIRIIEKMKEPGLRAYGSRLGIRDVSYARSGGNAGPGTGKEELSRRGLLY